MARASSTNAPVRSRGRSTGEIVVQVFGYLLLAVLSVILIMLISGDRFQEQLSYLGLYNKGAGLYTDCSDEGNGNSRFCQPEPTKYERDWKTLRKGGRLPFSLGE